MSLFSNEQWQVTVNVPYFGSQGTIEFLRFLAFSTPKEDVHPTKRVKSSHRVIRFEFTNVNSAETFVRSISKTFHPDFLSYVLEKKVLFDNPWDHLKAMVNAFDRYHEMSDDFRVYSAGQAELRAIKELCHSLSLVDKERVRDIVKDILEVPL